MKNGLPQEIGWRAKCFSSKYLCDHESGRINKTIENEITEPVTIYVYSQAVLTAIEYFKINSDAVLRCQTAPGNLSTTLRLCCVPDHCNIEGNKKSYELARMDSQPIDLDFADI